MTMDQTFQLYKLRVTMRHTDDDRKAYSKQDDGTYFIMSGEDLIFPCDGHSFPIYALASLMPLLPAKQRPTDDMDWMSTDCVVADPDPYSGLEYHIERLELETFNRTDVTAVNL